MPKKILRLTASLKNAREECSAQITPPTLSEDECQTIRKLIKPIQPFTNQFDEEEQDSTSKSNSPSPRGSIYWESESLENGDELETLKILVIGDSTVGKTSYVQGYIENKFQLDLANTVGVDFSSKILHNKKYGSKPIKLQIWDIAGQDRSICLTRVYYKNSDGCIIMFDLTNRASFNNVVEWKQDLDSKCLLSDGTILPCLLLASKCDLSNRQVELREIEIMCHKYNFMSWIEVSSKNHLMIEDSMNFLVDKIMCKKMYEKLSVARELSQPTQAQKNIKLNRDTQEPMKSRRSYCGRC